MKISVILPVHNRKDFIHPCLHSLRHQTAQDVEIIIIDDASTDGTRELLQALSKDEHLHVISLDHNQGASYARNVGIKASKGELLAFIDSDCLAHPSWLSEIALPFNQDPTIMISAGKTISPIATTYWELVNSSENFIAHHACFIENAPSCNMAIRRSFALCHPFDEKLRYSEDLDLCLLCLKQGGRIFYTDRAIIIHTPRATFLATFQRQFYWGYFNACVHFKHHAYPGISYGAWLILTTAASFFITLLCNQPCATSLLLSSGGVYLVGALVLHLRPMQKSPAGLIMSYPGFLLKCLTDSVGNIAYLCILLLKKLNLFTTHR